MMSAGGGAHLRQREDAAAAAPKKGASARPQNCMIGAQRSSVCTGFHASTAR